MRSFDRFRLPVVCDIDRTLVGFVGLGGCVGNTGRWWTLCVGMMLHVYRIVGGVSWTHESTVFRSRGRHMVNNHLVLMNVHKPFVEICSHLVHVVVVRMVYPACTADASIGAGCFTSPLL